MTGATTTGALIQIDSGTPLPQIAVAGTQHYFRLPTGTTGFLDLNIVMNGHLASPATVHLTIADVSATDTIAGIGSGMQRSRAVEVGGSVPTSGSIKVASPSATPLGTVMVYTCPDDGSGTIAALRQYRTSGNTVTTDAAAVSGSHEAFVTAGVPVGSGIAYSIPAGSLVEGTYAVLARVNTSAAATMDWRIICGLAGVSVGAGLSGLVSSQSTNGAGWFWLVLGSMALPPVPQPGESGLATSITAVAVAGTGTITIDELYLVNLTVGEVTLVNPFGLTPAPTRLWLDAADADPSRNRPIAYYGTADDRSDALGVPMVSIMSLGDHDLHPGSTTVFTVTDGVADAVVTAAFYNRWHTHAGA